MPPQSIAKAENRETTGFDAQCRGWLKAMAKGNETALSTFYEATVHRAYGVALRIIKDEALSEDIVTDTYYEVWQNAAAYDPSRGRPITWLLTICRNRALDEYRRRSSLQRTKETAAAMDLPDKVVEPDELLQAIQEGDTLRELLLALDSEQRQLLALAFFRGLSHQQIADYTATPLGTVKSTIRRALKALNAGLHDEIGANG